MLLLVVYEGGKEVVVGGDIERGEEHLAVWVWTLLFSLRCEKLYSFCGDQVAGITKLGVHWLIRKFVSDNIDSIQNLPFISISFIMVYQLSMVELPPDFLKWDIFPPGHDNSGMFLHHIFSLGVDVTI